MSDYLPDEIVVQILKCLPPKTLLRFRCVSRLWYSLISTLEFISSHLEYNHQVGNYSLLLKRYCRSRCREIYSFHDQNSGHRIIKELLLPFNDCRNIFSIVACVNGLACLWDDNHGFSRVILWNPAIRKCFKLPNPDDTIPRKEGCRKLSFGIGFDSLANEYKVLRIAFWVYDVKGRKNFMSTPFPFIRKPFRKKPFACTTDIFSMNTKSWRSITESVPLDQDSIGIFLNGSLHWLNWKEKEKVWSVVSFSMHSEAFTEMACPQEVAPKWNLHHRIAAFSDSILFFYDSNKCSVWVMKEYGVPSSWTKLYVIEPYMSLERKRILGFRWSEQLVLFGNDLYFGWPLDQSIEPVDLQLEGSYRSLHVEKYVECLALLQDGDNVAELLPNPINIGPWFRRRPKPIFSIHRSPSGKLNLLHGVLTD